MIARPTYIPGSPQSASSRARTQYNITFPIPRFGRASPRVYGKTVTPRARSIARMYIYPGKSVLPRHAESIKCCSPPRPPLARYIGISNHDVIFSSPRATDDRRLYAARPSPGRLIELRARNAGDCWHCPRLKDAARCVRIADVYSHRVIILKLRWLRIVFRVKGFDLNSRFYIIECIS